MEIVNVEESRSLSETELNVICHRSIMMFDKWHRMLYGMASNLKRYEDRIVYLTVSNNERYKPTCFETGLHFARKWVGCNKELAGARGFVAAFYKNRNLAGIYSGMFTEVINE